MPLMASKFFVTTVIAHIDHGKTTLLDSLLAHGGFISRSIAGNIKFLDTRIDEQLRGITMKNSVIRINKHYFIDTPGHVDFEQLLYSASLISDNFILLIDVNEGITPRAYTLIKFIDPNRTILILNKIDLNPDLTDIHIITIIEQLNNLIKQNIFSWEKNNVILSSTILSAGLNYKQLNKKLTSQNNTIKIALRYFYLLNDKISKTEDLETIKKKYNLKTNNKKIIYNTIFNLETLIFDLLNDFKTKPTHVNTNNLVQLCHKNNKGIMISTFASLLKPQITNTNVLFIFRVFNENIDLQAQPQYFYQNNIIEIHQMFTFNGDELVNITQAKIGMIIGIIGNFEKNPIITQDNNTCLLNIKPLHPFYKMKIIPNDIDDIEKLKVFFKTLSLIEQEIKVRKNRHYELEITCFGQIQFEKICEDLKLNNFKFIIRDFKKRFIEYPAQTQTFENDKMQIIISPSENIENDFEINSNNSIGLIKSVLAMLCRDGILIKEPIKFMKFQINIKDRNFQLTYHELKNQITLLYNKTNPSITPYFYNIKIFLFCTYINITYSLIQKHFGVIKNEMYDELNDFSIIQCYIPEFTFKDLTINLQKQCKGTIYIQLVSQGFQKITNFNDLISSIQIEKGIASKKYIIKDSTKQRTMKK